MNTYLPKILITGGLGQIGQAVSAEQHSQFDIKPCSRDTLDITNPHSIEKNIQAHQPFSIINLAAFTAVDLAEENKEQALAVNFQGTKNLAMACQKNNIPLIHLSTDYIFSGDKKTSYVENDSPQPINYYGETKFLGEQAILEYCQKYLILRVSGVFSEYKHNFLKTILRLAQEKPLLKIVNDQITCPTYANDIANVLFSILKYWQMRETHYGIYHYCSAHPVSWYEFAMAIIAHAKQNMALRVIDVQAVTSSVYQTPAKRPLNSVLNCERIFNVFNINQPSWEAGIKHILSTKGI